MKSRWAAIVIAAALFAADGKRPITETDLYAFQWIASPQISPDGSKIVYTLVKVTAKHDNYETALWMTPATGGAARQLTSGPRDSGARWSPDGQLLAFLRATEKDGQAAAATDLSAVDGGRGSASAHRHSEGRRRSGVVAGWTLASRFVPRRSPRISKRRKMTRRRATFE